MNAPRILGTVLLVALPVLLLAFLLTPAVRRPLGRALEVMVEDAFGGDAGDMQLAVDSTVGLREGDPIYLSTRAGALKPVAWVAGIEKDRLGIRLAPGEHLEGDMFRLPPPLAFPSRQPDRHPGGQHRGNRRHRGQFRRLRARPPIGQGPGKLRPGGYPRRPGAGSGQ